MNDEFQNPWDTGGSLYPSWDTNQWTDQSEALASPVAESNVNAYSNPSKAYQSALESVISELNKFTFGTAVEENTPENTHHDSDFWDLGELSLVLKKDLLPSDAYDAFLNPDNRYKWQLDCAQFVQAAHLCAMRRTLGTDLFNKKLGPRCVFKQHDSTGMSSYILYKRQKPDEPMFRQFNGTKVDLSVDELVAQVPIGSRIMWTNLHGRPPYRNENTVKMGDDLFASTPYGTVSRYNLEHSFVKDDKEDADDDYIKRNIFISQIEIYKT